MERFIGIGLPLTAELLHTFLDTAFVAGVWSTKELVLGEPMRFLRVFLQSVIGALASDGDDDAAIGYDGLPDKLLWR
jgi:hypothetical protein